MVYVVLATLKRTIFVQQSVKLMEFPGSSARTYYAILCSIPSLLMQKEYEKSLSLIMKTDDAVSSGNGRIEDAA